MGRFFWSGGLFDFWTVWFISGHLATLGRSICGDDYPDIRLAIAELTLYDLNTSHWRLLKWTGRSQF